MDTHYLRVAGMKRSGNHGIMNWILGLYPGCFYFHNYCNNPRAKELIKPTSSHLHLGDTHPKYIPVNRDKEKQLAIVSYEDKYPHEVFLPEMEKRYTEYYNVSSYHNVIILRDPYNMGASRLRREYQPGHWMRFPIRKGQHKDLIDLWKRYARLFQEKEDDPNWLCVCYNKWFKDIEYRKKLAEKLGRPFTDVGYVGTLALAGRSSFEKDSDTPNYKSDSRWKHYIDDPNYKEFIKDEEMQELSLAITGFVIPAKKTITPLRIKNPNTLMTL